MKYYLIMTKIGMRWLLVQPNRCLCWLAYVWYTIIGNRDQATIKRLATYTYTWEILTVPYACHPSIAIFLNNIEGERKRRGYNIVANPLKLSEVRSNMFKWAHYKEYSIPYVFNKYYEGLQSNSAEWVIMTCLKEDDRPHSLLMEIRDNPEHPVVVETVEFLKQYQYPELNLIGLYKTALDN